MGAVMADYQETILTNPPTPGRTFSTPDQTDTSDSDAATPSAPSQPRDTGIEWPLQGRRPNPYPNYIPIQPRGPSGWGKDDEHLTNFRNYPGMPPPSPHIPQPYQTNQLVQQIGGFFQKFGSNQGQLFAGQMLAGRGNFLKGVLAGQTAAANAQLKLYELNSVRLAEEERRRAYKYGEIFTLYEDKPALLFQKLTEAAQGHDDAMMAAIASGKVETVKKLIDYADTHSDALMKLTELRTKIAAEREKIEKEKTENEERRQWGLGGPSAPSAPTAGGPAPGATSTTPLGGGAPATGAPAGATPGAAPAASYALPPANPRVDNAARDRIMDRTSHEPGFAKGVVDDRVAQYETALDRIAENPNLNTKEQISAALRGVLPELAQQFDQYMIGKLPMSTRDADKGHWQRLVNLGYKTGSDIGPEAGKVRADTLSSFARGGKNAQNLLMLGTAARHLAAFEKEMGPEGQNIPGLWAYLSRYRGIGDITEWLGAVPKELRDKAATLKIQGDVAMDELYRSLVGGAGAERGREAKEAMANQTVLMPDVVARNVRTAHDLMNERIRELRGIFQAGVRGKPGDFEKVFDDAISDLPSAERAETKAVLTSLDRGAGPAPAAPAAPAGGGRTTGETATNPTTGAKIRWNGSSWEPVR